MVPFANVGMELGHNYLTHWASLVSQTVKNLPAMQETRVQSLGWEDPLENGGSTHSIQARILHCLQNSMDRGACWATVHGVTKSQK